MGSGTTGEVALKLGRSFIGIDLYEEYVQMTKERLENLKIDVDPRKVEK
jgi:DNA modification methylase